MFFLTFLSILLLLDPNNLQVYGTRGCAYGKSRSRNIMLPKDPPYVSPPQSRIEFGQQG